MSPSEQTIRPGNGVRWQALTGALLVVVLAIAGFTARGLSASDARQWDALHDHENRLSVVETHFAYIRDALARIEGVAPKSKLEVP